MVLSKSSCKFVLAGVLVICLVMAVSSRPLSSSSGPAHSCGDSSTAVRPNSLLDAAGWDAVLSSVRRLLGSAPVNKDHMNHMNAIRKEAIVLAFPKEAGAAGD
ncbi:hypothetical protein OEZ85_002504 [Tetradesmus obliquus]|uniref:Uncharacterized protein n=1 Tax=Tetradesmus obliquus TaxID=3088 RepID=A0ABY8TXS2_TETOB|nr:hypothetical protein OEZ85_002504 [Tetradesmus obliquus]